MKKIILLASVIAIIASFYLLGGEQYLSRDYYQQLFVDRPIRTALLFFIAYVIATGLSLPGAALLTLAGGAIFGFSWGLLIISFASTIGATMAFIITRLLLKDWVQKKFGGYFKTINKGMEKDGIFYLFTLRLIPLVPFVAINLVMGLMPIKVWRFYWVSQIGMLPGTAVFVYAGAQLGALDSFSLPPSLLAAFVLLATFPWISRRFITTIKRKKLQNQYSRPKQYTDNLIVIGAGAGGLVSSYIAAATKAKVTLIEKHKMGGDCLNTGCVPSKALIHAARLAHEINAGQSIGIHATNVNIDFMEVMASIHKSIDIVEPHDSVERYTSLGVHCIQGSAMIIDPWTIEVNGEKRTARNIIIAAGGRPRVPNIPGLNNMAFYTSDTLWEIQSLPKRLLVVGAGPIGCELAQSFHRLGSQVTIVDPAPQILGREDIDVIEVVKECFLKEGITIHTGYTPSKFEINSEGQKQVVATGLDNQSIKIEFDDVLLAVGREANISGYGLENLNVEIDERGNIAVDEYLETSMPGVYAVGDAIGGYQFTHVSSHEAWYASVNALFGQIKRFKADYSVIPWVTYTSPEVGRVGLSEESAKADGVEFEVTRFAMEELDRAIVDQVREGFVKVLTVPGKDKILGATIVGANAGELIAEFVLAMRHGLGLNKILGTIHAYPTMVEANKYIAGEWKRNHAPKRLLEWAAKYHNWRRG